MLSRSQAKWFFLVATFLSSAAFIALTACSVNYREFGQAGFDAIGRLVDRNPVLSATYPDTQSAVALLEQVVG